MVYRRRRRFNRRRFTRKSKRFIPRVPTNYPGEGSDLKVHLSSYTLMSCYLKIQQRDQTMNRSILNLYKPGNSPEIYAGSQKTNVYFHPAFLAESLVEMVGMCHYTKPPLPDKDHHLSLKFQSFDHGPLPVKIIKQRIDLTIGVSSILPPIKGHLVFSLVPLGRYGTAEFPIFSESFNQTANRLEHHFGLEPVAKNLPRMFNAPSESLKPIILKVQPIQIGTFAAGVHASAAYMKYTHYNFSYNVNRTMYIQKERDLYRNTIDFSPFIHTNFIKDYTSDYHASFVTLKQDSTVCYAFGINFFYDTYSHLFDDKSKYSGTLDTEIGMKFEIQPTVTTYYKWLKSTGVSLTTYPVDDGADNPDWQDTDRVQLQMYQTETEDEDMDNVKYETHLFPGYLGRPEFEDNREPYMNTNNNFVKFVEPALPTPQIGVTNPPVQSSQLVSDVLGSQDVVLEEVALPSSGVGQSTDA